ncbi:MAG: biopolymer transporter ExbD [Spirochaetaceae bacterium]|jgi:biopolymer transport protein ExbD|nr:biopolymer transporter ExbD [Spirochaetaceae bacterium]
MTLRRPKKKGAEENSALSDLAFLLIIYFIVIAGFNVNKGFLMNLPVKDSMRLIPREELLRFELNGSGTLFLNEGEISLENAEQVIADAIAVKPNLAVLLLADANTSWQDVVNFVELAQRLEVDSFSFKMKEEG